MKILFEPFISDGFVDAEPDSRRPFPYDDYKHFFFSKNNLFANCSDLVFIFYKLDEIKASKSPMVMPDIIAYYLVSTNALSFLIDCPELADIPKQLSESIK